MTWGDVRRLMAPPRCRWRPDPARQQTDDAADRQRMNVNHDDLPPNDFVWPTPLISKLTPPYYTIEGGAIGLPGMERILCVTNNLIDPPPINWLTGIAVVSASPGSASFSMPVTGWSMWYSGEADAGMLAVLACASHSGAAYGQIGPGATSTPMDMSISFARPLSTGAGPLTTTSRVVHATLGYVLSDTVIYDESGLFIGKTTMRHRIVDIRDGGEGGVLDVELEARAADGCVVAQPPIGQPIPADVSTRLTGIDVIRGQIAGEFPAPSLYHLTGLRPVLLDQDGCGVVMPANPWLTSHDGHIQSGALALLAQSAAHGVVTSRLPAGRRCRVAGLHLAFLQEAHADGRNLRASSRIVGGTDDFWFCTLEIADSDGRLLAMGMATVTGWHLVSLPAEKHPGPACLLCPVSAVRLPARARHRSHSSPRRREPGNVYVLPYCRSRAGRLVRAPTCTSVGASVARSSRAS